MTETEPRELSLDVLRRRVYEPDASDADRERYRLALEAAAAPAEPPAAAEVAESGEAAGGSAPGSAPEPPSAARIRRRSRLVIGGIVLAIAVTVAIATHPWSPPVPSGPQSRPLAIPSAARHGFIAGLDRGGSADFGRYIYDHPDARPAEVTTLNWAESEEHVGTGTATVALDPSALANHGGHLTVVVILARDAVSAWTALGSRPDPHYSEPPGIPVTVHGRQTAGVPGTATLPYARLAPTVLSVEVPAGVRWDAFVVFSN